MVKITEGRTNFNNPLLNFFVHLSIVGYNGAKIGERGNCLQDIFLFLNINSGRNSWGMVTDRLMDKFHLFYADGQSKFLNAQENLLRIHYISSRVWTTSAQSSAKCRSQTVCIIVLVLALKHCWLNNQPLVLNSSPTLSLTFSNTFSSVTENTKQIREVQEYNLVLFY